MFRTRSPVAIVAAMLACSAFAATAAALVSTSAGTNQLSIVNIAERGSFQTQTPGWVTLPGAKSIVTVPPGGATINVRFTAESKCGGTSVASICSVRIGANGNEWNPKITNTAFAFDRVANAAGGAGGKEGHAIERSLTLAGGTYNVHVALNVTPNTSFSVAYWHLAIETSAP